MRRHAKSSESSSKKRRTSRLHEFSSSSRSLEKKVRAQKKKRRCIITQVAEKESSQRAFATRRITRTKHEAKTRQMLLAAVVVVVVVVFLAQDFPLQPKLSAVHCATSNQNVPPVKNSTLLLVPKKGKQVKPTPSQNAKQSNSTRVVKAKVVAPLSPRNDVRRNPQDQLGSPDLSGVEEQQLQISITPRVSMIRVPVDSNAMLKCLISSSSSSSSTSASSSSKLNQKFDVHWSRFMYDEHVYEQLDTSPLLMRGNSARTKRWSSASASSQSEDVLTGKVPFNRQEQLRDFLARSRQETNVISDLLIEATLSISPVKASDNASYYCTAFDSRPPAAATSGAFDQNQARIDLVALSRPVVQLERVIPARDSKSAQIHWLVLSDGNTPITKTMLMVRNDTGGETFSSRPLPPELAGATASAASVDYYETTTTQSQYSSMVIDSDLHQWQKIEIPPEDDTPPPADSDTSGSLMSPYDHPSSSSSSSSANAMASADVDVTSPLGASSSSGNNNNDQQQDYFMSRLRWNLLRSNKRRQRSYNLSSLLPGVTYNFRLAAINDMGQSEWSQLTATMPNEIPAQIGEMFLLSRTNDTLVIGWRRPAYDTSKTVRYEMQLFDLNRTLTLDAFTNTSSATSAKTNFMYIFVNLNPGTDYHFHVRACSRAGCSAYSSPKLLASTLDGEPDEPLEVELSCEYDRPPTGSPAPSSGSGGGGGNVSVSWLPPANPRGQLLNYSVAFESRARFRNQSGQWQVDEWRSNMETADNQTLSLDATGILLPNTNYSVRVCANNRSKHCGRLSQLTSKSQCSTPPELPNELPSGIRLKRQTSPEDPATSGESLQLELPHISARNGTLSCIQVILIRLPASFADSNNLADFLPERADSVTLSRYSGESQQKQKTPEQALAYLAEEIDPSAAQQVKHVVTLGDGRHEQCRMRGPAESIARPEVFDGPLRARTYYTGFVKLILIRTNRLRSKYSTSAQMKRSTLLEEQNQQQEILTKYSGYFEPIQLGEHVLELSSSSGSSGEDALDVVLGDSSSTKLRPLQVMASELGDNLRRELNKFYNLTSSYVGENLRLERLGDFIRKSSPLMQLLEVGVIVIVISLLLLLFVYLLTLPTTIARRRKRRIKRQLNKHQQQAAQQQQASLMSQQENQLAQKMTDFDPQLPLPAPITDTTDYLGQLSPPIDLQQQQQQQRTMYGNPRECPIHSSPATSNNSQQQQQQQVVHRQPQMGHEHRQAAVHVCQPMMVYGNGNTIDRRQSSDVAEQQTYHYHQHQHPTADAEQYERNCRTTRRNQADLQALSAKNCLTLSHQQQLNSSVMALAKKINKSIPLRLFRAVLECRLRNGWLKDEYEQLPNPLLAVASEPNQKVAPQETVMKLRPQLIVSRNDSVSALISGNDQYDAGLLVTPPAGNQQQQPLLQQRRIICAKSPLDADSVWDFWRLVYEQDVSTIVMLTQNEDSNTGELRCAQYWPTCDNEETTILSPCNEYVQKSQIRPAKFKIRQETLDSDRTAADGFMVRRLTLIVMATKAGENGEEDDTSVEAAGETGEKKTREEDTKAAEEEDDDDDDEKYVIVERDILQLQLHCWNTSTPANQLRLITFIRRANERHLMNLKQQQDTEQISPQRNANNPMLVHCFNGLGRSGVFAGLSFLLDELMLKLRLERQQQQQQQQPQQVLQKVNLFQLVGRMRLQREMIISPYRFYELLYQLTANCVPHDMATTLH